MWSRSPEREGSPGSLNLKITKITPGKSKSKGKSQKEQTALVRELVEENEALRQEKLQFEISRIILRKFKDIYQSAEAITCAGCHHEFKPVTFKCHLDRCPMLQEEEPEDQAEEPTRLDVRVKWINNEGGIQFEVDHQGLSWVTDRMDITDVQFVARSLKKEFPNLSAFTTPHFEKFMTLQRKELEANKATVEKFMADLSKFEVARNDLNLRTLLQIN